MKKENKIDLIKIIISILLLGLAYLLDRLIVMELWQRLLIYLVPYLFSAYKVIFTAFYELIHGNVFNEGILMFIATIGALSIGFLPGSEAEFLEASLVMIFFNTGELLEEIAQDKSHKTVKSLLEIRPDKATLIKDEEIIRVDAKTIKKGEIILIKAGERIPLDGIVIEGSSSLNMVALTGESIPKDVTLESEVLSGAINLNGVLKVKVLKEFGESTATKILELVENAQDNKSKDEKFIARFAKYYTPIIVSLALIISFLPPLISLNFHEAFPKWLYRGLSFLVVSCPCALVISIPLAFFSGIGRLAREGVLVKGSNHLEALAKTETVVFDKTGTLTKGVFEVVAVHPSLYDEETILHLSAHTERLSTHPIALSLRKAYANEDDECEVKDIVEFSGEGISALINNIKVSVGNVKFMDRLNIKYMECSHLGTIIHVVIDDLYAGHIVISDVVKEDSKEAIIKLKEAGIKKTVMLTGDSSSSALAIKEDLDIDEYYADLMPIDKVNQIEKMLDKTQNVCFVGDGINDAPVIMKADVGIAMGTLGSDSAIEAADIIIMDDKLSKLPLAIKISKKVKNISKQNIYFSLIVKGIILILASIGYAPMWLCVFGDVGVTLIAILNSIRALKINK